MLRFILAALTLGLGLTTAIQAKEIGTEVAAGEWSKPVADTRGYALQGRLVIYETKREENIRRTAVYVELREASDFVGADLQLYCEMGKHDLRPEYKQGLNCELRDKDGALVKSAPFAFGGGTPKSQWITLPCDATIRLRATPYGIGSGEGLAICPGLGNFWVIANDDPNEYQLSATFGIDPAESVVKPQQEHIWRGVIELPPLKVGSRKK